MDVTLDEAECPYLVITTHASEALAVARANAFHVSFVRCATKRELHAATDTLMATGEVDMRVCVRSDKRLRNLCALHGHLVTRYGTNRGFVARVPVVEDARSIAEVLDMLPHVHCSYTHALVFTVLVRDGNAEDAAFWAWVEQVDANSRAT